MNGRPRELRGRGLVEIIDRLEMCRRHDQDVPLGDLSEIDDRPR